MPQQKQSRLTEEEFYNMVDAQPEDFEEFFDTRRKLEVYQDLYIHSKNAEIDDVSKSFYKNKYLHALLKIGFQIKEIWMKDMSVKEFSYNAQRQFQRAITIEPNLPIAHYRLGHIFFKENNLGKAADFFDASLKVHYPGFELEEYQVRNARTILSYCGIMLFKQHSLPEDKASDYPELDAAVESFLSQQDRSFYPVIKLTYTTGQKPSLQELSREEYTNLCLSATNDPQVILIDTYQNRPTINYRERNQYITETQYNTLQSILDQTFNEDWHSIQPPTRRKRLERLRELFNKSLIPQSIFQILNLPGADPIIQSDLPIILLKRIED